MGKQGLAFRGTHENIGKSAQKCNPGNFLVIVQKIAHHNPALRDHIEAPLRKDVSYLGPKSQNELIEIIGKKCIQERFVKEMKAAKYHSILADEVTSSNKEILSVVARYLNEEKDVREVFLDFLNLDRITGEHIGKRLLQFYQNGVDVGSCRGRCYEGASSIQS